MKHTKKIILGCTLALATISLASCNDEIKGYVRNNTLTYVKGDHLVSFGKMAQTKVSEDEVKSLGLTPSDKAKNNDEIVEVEGNAYYKVVKASVNATSLTKASTGEVLETGNTYWFKMEDITWRVLAEDGSDYILLSENIIASSAVYNASRMTFDDNKTGYAVDDSARLNRYLSGSNAKRAWTTQIGLDTENKYIDSTKLISQTFTQTVIDGHSESVTALAKTLSEEELNSYEATNSQVKRIALTTDYARATGTWTSIDEKTYGYGTYWLRDTTTYHDANLDEDRYSGMFKIVDEQGNIKDDYGFNTFGGVRPVIRVAKSSVTEL